MDELERIKTFFQSHSLYLSTAWLEGCISWCTEENLPSNYTAKDLQHKVFEQWLLLDLRDVDVPCLPPNLSSKIKYVLNDNYSLQMMKVMDISRPKHWQLQRIRNNVSKNTEPEVESSKRVLQLTLTDGVQEVEAVEYEPVSCLSLNLSPGIKIRLMGPITVRRGRLMLENKHVKVLGGEVDELIVPNAAENVLASILKLELNPTPNVIQESLLTANKDMFNDTGETATRTQNNIRNNTSMSPNIVNRNISENSVARMTNVPNINSSFRRNNDPQMPDPRVEEELRIAEEIDLLMEAERDFEEQVPKKMKQRSKTPDMFDDDDFNDSVFENIDIPPVAIKSVEQLKQPPRNNNEIIKSQDNYKSLEIENDFFDNFDVDAHLDQSTKAATSNPTTPKKPLVLPIEKLLKNLPNIGNGKFKIRVKFNSIVEKLTFVNDEYYLVLKVEDETGDLTVRVHNDVVADLAGSPPAPLLALKADIMDDNTDAKRKIFEALRQIKEKLIRLNHIVEVQISMNEKFPVMINILE